MAEKPGFMIYHKEFEELKRLPPEIFHAFFCALDEYSTTGVRPATLGEPTLDTLFGIYCGMIDRDTENYDRKVAQRKKAIEKRWKMQREKETGDSRRDASDTDVYESLRTDTDVYDRIRPNTDEYERYQNQFQNQSQNQFQNHSLSLREIEGAERERPTLEMVEEYARDAGLDVDARQFIAQNEATGWTDGNGRPVKNWRIWLQGWALRNRPGAPAKPTPTAMAFEQRTYTGDELKAMTDAMFEDALKNCENGKREATQ